MTLLINGIRCDNLDATITMINTNDDMRVDFKRCQLILAEHIRLVDDRQRSNNRSVASTYTARGRGQDRGGRYGVRGRGGGGGGDSSSRFDPNTGKGLGVDDWV